MTGGHDPDNRKDFPGGWAEDKIDKFTKAGRTKDEQEMFAWTQKWILLRKESKAVRKGKTIDLFYDDESYVFARDSVCDPTCDLPFVFAINNSNKEKTIAISLDEILPMDGLKDGETVYRTHLENDFEPKAKRVYETNGKYSIVLPPKSITAYRGTFVGTTQTEMGAIAKTKK
jgi:glycosidase